MATTVATRLQIFPSYIREFLDEENECILVYRKSLSNRSSSKGLQEELDYSNGNIENVANELDLTGNPLIISLNESVMMNLQCTPTCDVPNWTSEESHQFPLSLSEARNILQVHHSKKSRLPVFCITNACDSQNTVILGSHYSDNGLTTYMMQVVEHHFSHHEANWEFLKTEHERYVRGTINTTKYNVKRTYNIHKGDLKKSSDLENSNHNGCMSVELSWNQFCREPPEFGTEMKLNIRVMPSHKFSPIRFIWTQVTHLQKLLDILEDEKACNNGKTLISEDPEIISDLIRNIHNMCNSKLYTKRNIKKKIDLTNLRHETILDKLWVLLLRCQSLADLKNCVATFFMIASREKFDKIGSLVFRQYIGGANVPTLRFETILNMLIYIGFEKLKEDYFAIVNCYYSVNRMQLLKKWSEFKAVKDLKESDAPPNWELIDMTSYRQMMEFLIKLHEASEILVYVEKPQFGLFESNFSLICKYVIEEYLLNESDKKPDYQKNVKLLEISCELNPQNKEVFKNKDHLKTIIEMTSRSQESEIISMYHISQNKIIPDNIYDYGIVTDGTTLNNSNESMPKLWYVSKMVLLNNY